MVLCSLWKAQSIEIGEKTFSPILFYIYPFFLSHCTNLCHSGRNKVIHNNPQTYLHLFRILLHLLEFLLHLFPKLHHRSIVSFRTKRSEVKNLWTSTFMLPGFPGKFLNNTFHFAINDQLIPFFHTLLKRIVFEWKKYVVICSPISLFLCRLLLLLSVILPKPAQKKCSTICCRASFC